MKSFFWKILICVVPVILSCWIIYQASLDNYAGFKFGVDLKGGTILVYEIDQRKLEEQRKKEGGEAEQTADDAGDYFKRKASELAAALKRRIDPTATYNIVVRPAGGEGRVEIILPTGGIQDAREANEQWQKILDTLEKEYPGVGDLAVPRGNVEELIDRIQRSNFRHVWQTKLFNSKEAWTALLDRAEKKWIELKLPYIKRIENEVPIGNIERLSRELARVQGITESAQVQKLEEEVKSLAKGIDQGKDEQAKAKAWNELLTKVQEKWKVVTKTPIEQLRAIPAGDLTKLTDQLTRELGLDSPTQIETWIKEQAWTEMITRVVHAPEIQNALLRDELSEAKRTEKDNEIKTQIDTLLKAKDNEDLLKQLQALAKDKNEKVAKWAAVTEKSFQAHLNTFEEELKTIPPDSFEELIGRITSKGMVLAQGVLDAAAPLLGRSPDVPGQLDRNMVESLVTANYGPSESQIKDKIATGTDEKDGSLKNLTVEEVQRIKDLVAKVGALEFRILANDVDDKQAIEAAQKWIESASRDPAVKEELERAALNGEPPPGPRDEEDPTKLKVFDILLKGDTKENPTKVTYSWVELGKEERKALSLDNASRTAAEQDRRTIWNEVHKEADHVLQIPRPSGTTGGKFMWQGALFYWRECKDRNLPEKERRAKQFEYFVLTRNPELDPNTLEPTPRIDGSYLVSASTDMTGGRPAVAFIFNSRGGDLFARLTRKNVPTGSGPEESQIKRHLAIILDGLVMSAPTVNSEIRTHGQITGDFNKRTVDNLVNILRSGALPATLKPQPVSESTIGALLGQDTINAGVFAIQLAFVAVVVFMILYYRFAGFVACVALFANLVLTIAFMVLVQATFTLPGLAGLVLMLGMAVDANVLIYERLREERDRGASLPLALRNGYERALPTIIDTHLSSIFTAVVLYAVGNDQLKGFGISLTVGLIISLFTSLYMTRVMFDFWLARGWLWKLSMFRLLSNPNINFMALRNYVLPASFVITVLGLALFMARMPRDLDIDFKGGTAFGGQLKPGHAMDIQELRGILSEDRQQELLQIKDVEEVAGSNGREFVIVYEEPKTGATEKREVILANEATVEQIKQRAGFYNENGTIQGEGLRDWSVEQLFPSQFVGAEATNKSRFFNVRTSEMERDLVQTMLDRLFREYNESDKKWESILNMIRLDIDTSELGQEGKENIVRLRFYVIDKDGKKQAPINPPTHFKTLFERELRQVFQLGMDANLPVKFDMATETQSDTSFLQMRLKFFDEDLQPDTINKIKTALADAHTSFLQRPQPDRLENFDPELAANTRLRALMAIFASWVAVVLYLWFRFGNWTFGMAAVLCLVHDLCFALGLVAISAYIQPTFFGQWLKIEDFKIDFNGVAALLTLVGYSVADTIVVFDRIREVRGKNPELTPKIINDSINATLSRTLLTSGTTFLVVAVLYWFGGPGLHLFSFIMCVGVVIGTFSSIYIASPLLLVLGEGKRGDSRGERRPRQTQTVGAGTQ